ncbi:MAG TPA: DHCW motif cupin fold protein [Thermoanaerobaculia bacterium]|nr:DHCW motif cupin fold protein [Thermoanaerobaculia bacterium]
MRIEGVPFALTDWTAVPETIHPGETGVARRRTVQAGNVRVRMVTHSPGYLADHWCSRGHILLVLEGVLVTEIQNGPSHTLSQGMSYQVSDDVAPHRSSTETGARLFIVD